MVRIQYLFLKRVGLNKDFFYIFLTNSKEPIQKIIIKIPNLVIK